MKNFLVLSVALGTAFACRAATTIDAVNKFAYGANIGWMDMSGDSTNGVVIGEYVCSGYMYSANVGWINFGSGALVNHVQYQNNAANDFGVNQDGLGNLRGYAYAANIGWINFETNGAPKVDLVTGKMSGSVYSANGGWISLSNSVAFVQTDTISPGLLDTNGLPFAWEYQNFGTAGIDPNDDPDHDGMSNLEEYLAGTDPNNAADFLAITAFNTPNAGTNVDLTWTSHPTRQYYIQKRFNLNPTTTWSTAVWASLSPLPGARPPPFHRYKFGHEVLPRARSQAVGAVKELNFPPQIITANGK